MSSQIPNSNDPFNVPSPPTSASIADADGIEHEWLDRTHHVMQSFATDPYQLSKELAVVRADYIKHRYGKVIHTGTPKEGKAS